MDFKSTIDLIIKDLNEASEIIDDLKKYPGVPALQVELAKSKCKSAGEVISLLKNLSDYIPVKHEPVEEKVKHEPVEEKVKHDPLAEKRIPEPPVVSIEKKTESKVTEKKTQTPTPIVADKFGHIPDHYKENPEVNQVPKHLKRKHVANLSEAIGINDRFLFIREIFDGNKDIYTQAISRLDKVENLDDAVAIIMSYTGEKPENEAVTQLLDLVRLKLPDNE
jgi:hypothetical protein